MSQKPGKKLGMLEVQLDRKKDRYTHVTVDVELRFEISNGTFHAQYEGNWFHSKTKDDLAAQIKAIATKTLSVEWKRYIEIDYAAKGWPIEDPKSGRPANQGQCCDYGLDDDRKKPFDDSEGPPAICAISLQWSLCEISEPYTLPENPKKRVRARRDVRVWDWLKGTAEAVERLGDPNEWDDDVLPTGLLLWTPEREAILVEIIAALGRLDARLVGLFSGDAAKLAGKLDELAIGDASRLLTEGSQTMLPATSKSKRRTP